MARGARDVPAVISIDGSWNGSGFGAGFAIGLTFGLPSPFIGPSIMGTHDLNATLSDERERVASHWARVESKITWGIAGDANEVAAKADELLQAESLSSDPKLVEELISASRSSTRSRFVDPYKEAAERFGLSEEEVLEMISRGNLSLSPPNCF